MSDLQNLSDSLDDDWVQRLWQRGEQPGVVRLAQMQATAVRLTHQGHLPLADEVVRRYVAVMALQQHLPPIVYAQPALPVNAPHFGSAIGEARSPLPVVSAQPAVAAANGLAVKPLVVNPLVVPAAKVDPPPTTSQRPSSAQTDGRAPDHPSPAEPTHGSTAVSPLPLPVVRPQLPAPLLVNRSINRAATQPANRANQSEIVGRPTAAFPSKPSLSAQGDAPVLAAAALAVPTSNPITPLPVVRTAVTPLLPTPTAQPSVPLVVQPSSPKASQPDNGRTAGHTALPIAREQFSAAPVPATMNQPLPLAQPTALPMAGVIQRAAQGTAVNRPTSPHRPTPAPSRTVPTAGVVQRTAQVGSTAVIQRQDETDAVPATAEAMDMDELVDKVHRRFLRRLAVEGERRGKTSWP